mmetsp:Transcript_24260/g.44539  ORF Transcript_24260/g.44539 Transcript_24260/m.44539 type:complete len:200 (+) Transcript_24260:127-726(+)
MSPWWAILLLFCSLHKLSQVHGNEGHLPFRCRYSLVAFGLKAHAFEDGLSKGGKQPPVHIRADANSSSLEGHAILLLILSNSHIELASEILHDISCRSRSLFLLLSALLLLCGAMILNGSLEIHLQILWNAFPSAFHCNEILPLLHSCSEGCEYCTQGLGSALTLDCCWRAYPLLLRLLLNGGIVGTCLVLCLLWDFDI